MLIELNGSAHNDFQHIHLLSDDSVGPVNDMRREFGIARRGQPSKEVRVNGKGLYPKQWEGRTELAPITGRAIDHFAISVDDLEAALARLRKDGVSVSDARTGPGKLKSAFVEGPDRVRIELVEGHASRS